MPNYLYKTTLYKSTDDVIGFSPSNDSDKEDFENNFKSQAQPVHEITLAETTYEVEKSYEEFKSLLGEMIKTWSDVIYKENNKKYELNLLINSTV